MQNFSFPRSIPPAKICASVRNTRAARAATHSGSPSMRQATLADSLLKSMSHTVDHSMLCSSSRRPLLDVPFTRRACRGPTFSAQANQAWSFQINDVITNVEYRREEVDFFWNLDNDIHAHEFF